MKNEITYKKKNKDRVFSFNDIKFIELHQSYAYSEGRTLWLPTDPYNYSKIVLKDNDKFIATSLLLGKLDIAIDANVRLRKRFMSSIFCS